MTVTCVANAEDPHQAEDDQAEAEQGLLRERDHQAEQYTQDWVFTDVVPGPWQDEHGRAANSSERTTACECDVQGGVRQRVQATEGDGVTRAV